MSWQPELPGSLDLTSPWLIPSSIGRREILVEIRHGGEVWPIESIELGSEDPSAPTLLLVAGVHGLERIGVQVVLTYLDSIAKGLEWDTLLASALEQVRLILIPVLNPSGYARFTRSNANGVDLMRNAPVDSPEAAAAWRLYRGHRLSPRLPWYRGDGPMEAEARALCDFVERKLFGSSFVLSVDVHSGFMGPDRLWFPYAKSQEAISDVAEVTALKRLLDRTQPHHRYRIEPQSTQYTTHGDLWDYLYDRYRSARPDGLFLPFTLELGASSWLRKNPLQAFRALGLFHPIKPHRVERVLRRHGQLFDFLLRAAHSRRTWSQLSGERRAELSQEAARLWPQIALDRG
jgi:hypothetical protein